MLLNQIFILGRNEKNLEKVAQKIRRNFGENRVLTVVGDLQNDPNLPEKLISETIREYGRLDILVRTIQTC